MNSVATAAPGRAAASSIRSGTFFGFAAALFLLSGCETNTTDELAAGESAAQELVATGSPDDALATAGESAPEAMATDVDDGIVLPPAADTDGSTEEPAGEMPVLAARSLWVSWRTPTERANGEALPLAEISGYRIYFGALDNPIAHSIEVDDSAVTTFQLDGITSGTWQVAVSAVDRDGLESELSNAMTKVIQ